ncbi:PspC domain-containing protein [Spirillospora sp. NPDC029432]|uniref:PspC domain-containing protein n=1 Tax=Spirillospora sp. NPDC029432 TaxID=3154599 RepID=UPI003454EFEB
MVAMADEDRAPEAPAPRAPRALSRLAREADGRILGGVCTGLGRYTGIDPVVYRVGFAILVFSHGQGIPLYVAAVLFMPAAPGRAAVAERLFRRRFDAAGVLSVLGALLCAAVALSLLGTGLFGAGVSTDTVAVLTVLGLVMLVAHGRGVDLAAAARAFPERLQGHPPLPEDEAEEKPMAVSFEKSSRRGAPGGDLPEGMVDLARFSGPRAAPPAPEPVREPAGATAAVEKCRGGHSPLTSVTLLGALAAGAAVFPMARVYDGPQATMIVSATALAVIGGGLLLGGWFRARGLAAMGTVLTCALLTSSVAAEAPPGARYGEIEWRPVDASAAQDYKVGAGTGRLDLTALPLRPGQRVSVNAEIWFGELDVRLPAAARVEVDARIGLGDLDLPGRSIGGPNARSSQVLEPEGPRAEDPPVIVLRIRGRFGDVRVSRG